MTEAGTALLYTGVQGRLYRRENLNFKNSICNRIEPSMLVMRSVHTHIKLVLETAYCTQGRPKQTQTLYSLIHDAAASSSAGVLGSMLSWARG